MFGKKFFFLENLSFYALLVISLINIWAVDVYVTIDGPTHLYNAGLLNLLNGNSFLNNFYLQNNLFLPNYFSHLILSKLFLLFNPFTSEKIFLSIFVLFLPISFRYVIKLYTKNTLYSFLIFPLVFTFLLHVGFFNFCFAFIFLNCQLALLNFFLENKTKWYHLALFSINSILLFNAHAFVFAITLILVFLLTILYFRASIKLLTRKLIFLFLLFVPALALFSVFYFKYSIPNYNYPTTDYEKFSKILDFSPVMTYSKETDGLCAGILLCLIFFLANTVFLKRFVIATESKKIIYQDVFMALAVLLVPIIIYTNSGWLSGMLTDRLVFIFFYFIIFWIAFNAIEFKAIYVVSVFIVFVCFYKLSSKRNKVLTQISTQAQKIISASNYLKEGSTIYSINYSDSWLEPHFSNYLGINKNIVNLDNYEAELGWFPLKWNEQKRASVIWDRSITDIKTTFPDYIFIYGDLSKIDKSENQKLKQFIISSTIKRYQSKDNYCCLYEVRR